MPIIQYSFGRLMCPTPYVFYPEDKPGETKTPEQIREALQTLDKMRQQGLVEWLGDDQRPYLSTENVADKIIQAIRKKFPDAYVAHDAFLDECWDDNFFFRKGIQLNLETPKGDEIKSIVGEVLHMEPGRVRLESKTIQSR